MHHVDLPEQVVNTGEELWVKIIDIDLQRRRISLSIKQAAEGGEVSEEYREAFGEHAYDEQGNYIGFDYGDAEFTPETEAQAAWADLVEHPDAVPGAAVCGGPRHRAGRPARPRSGAEPQGAEDSQGSPVEAVVSDPEPGCWPIRPPARSPSRLSPAENPAFAPTQDPEPSGKLHGPSGFADVPSSRGEVPVSGPRRAAVWPSRARRWPSSTVTRSRPTRSRVRSAGVAFVADVSDHEQMRDVVADAARELGGLSVVFANAGIGSFGAVDEMDPD